MALQKLETVNAFVVRDLGNDAPAIGVVRAAPKVLQGGAKDLARAQTYQCALFNMRCQGASAGISAAPPDRDIAVSSFVDELLPATVRGELMLDPAKGVPVGALDRLLQADRRNAAHLRTIDGEPNRHHLLSLGAVAAADQANGLDGKRVAIENFEQAGLGLAMEAAARGASIVAISTTAGMARSDLGFDGAALAEAWRDHGPDLVSQFEVPPSDAADILAAPVDTLFVGSKMGALNHVAAATVQAKLIVPTGHIPYTTKGALMLEAQDTTVLPDIVTTAGGLFAGMPPAGDDQNQIESSVIGLIATLTDQILGQNEIPIIEACLRAESFMKGWLDELPFGRPFAA